MQFTISKLAALLLALAYIIAAGAGAGGWSFAGLVALAVLFPLALIWFPDEIESWTRFGRGGGLPGLEMRPSAGWLVVTMGWVLLVVVPLLNLLLNGR